MFPPTQASFCTFCDVKICVQVSRRSGGIALVTVCFAVPLQARWAYLFLPVFEGKQQQSMSERPERRLLKSKLTIAGKTSSMAARLKSNSIPACRQNTLSAGIGIIAAAKNADTLLIPARSTDRPVRFNTTPVCSPLGTSFTESSAYVCVSRNMS